MRTSINLLVLTLLIGFSLTSCNSNNNKGTSTHPEKKTIEEIVQIPTDFTLNYTLEKEEDLSYNGIVRNQLRITIPTGLTKEDIENNIKKAVLDCFKKNESDGISVLVFEKGDNIESAYTVAMGEFAPMGNWNLVQTNANLSTFKIKIEFKEAYFNPKAQTFKKGDSVKLYKEKAWSRTERKMVNVTSVPLSKSAREWTEEFIIINIPNNTLAKIVEIHKEKLTDGSEFIRYQVETQYNGKKYTGWINSEEAIQ